MKFRIVEDRSYGLLVFEVHVKGWFFGQWRRVGTSNTFDGANYIINGHLGVELIRAPQEEVVK